MAVLQSSLKGDAVDIEKIFATLGLKPLLAGKANATADMTTRGRSPRDLVSAVSGNIKSQSQRGAIVGWDIGRDWVNMVWTRDAGPYDGRARTPYQRITADIELEAGEVKRSTFDLATTVIHVSGNATASLASQKVDLRARLAAAIPPPLRIPFRLSGPWSKPKLGLDEEHGSFLSVIASLFQAPGGSASAPDLNDPQLHGLLTRAKGRTAANRRLEPKDADALRTVEDVMRQ